MIDLDPTTQDGLSFLVQNFNEGKAPEQQLNDEQYLFDLPVRNNSSSDPRDTVVRVVPRGDSGLRGRHSIFYPRIDLSTFADIHLTGSYATMADVIAVVNRRLGLKFVPEDYVEATPVAGEVLEIVMKPTSYLYIGRLSVHLPA